MDKVALEYLSPPTGSFWRWQENGDVIEWVDGKTITFRSELITILQGLSARGLPPLGTILLVLAAARDSWKEVVTVPYVRNVASTSPAILVGILSNCAAGEVANSILVQVLHKLCQISELDGDLRSSLEAKLVLCEMLLSDHIQLTSIETAHRIIAQLKLGLGEELEHLQANDKRHPIAANVLLADLRSLDRCIEQVDPEQLRLRRKTGLDQVPEPVELELPPAQKVRALLADLLNDDELSGLARLALNLMAAVTMPRAIADREELQMGGVSDISNRGPLDRLLLSELAHDDLTLAVRVAMNEAMYLRRESPPRTPPRQRSVLLEAGLRSWGVPRLFSTSVALALAATSDPHIDLLVYRASVDQVRPVDLTTRSGLVEHLSALEPELHPGNALTAFETELSLAPNPAEPLLIMEEDVLEDPHFRKSLDDSNLLPAFIATVNRDGQFCLSERSRRGSKPLREAKLNLESLFADDKARKPKLIDRNLPHDLPAIFSVEPFPLLLSHQIDQSRLACVTGQGVLTMPSDGRLMYWNAHNQGAIQLAERIPSGALWWCSRDPMDEMIYAVVGHLSPSGLHLLRIDLNHYRCESERLELDRGVRSICAHRGVIFAIYQQHVQVVSLSNGQVIQRLELPSEIVWQRSRFFRKHSSGTWYALSYDGRTALLEKVLSEHNLHCPPLQTLFEADGIDGPLAITDQGHVYQTASDELRKVNYPWSETPRVLNISPDGKRVALSFSADSRKSAPPPRVLDISTLDISRFYSPHYWTIDPELRRLISPTNMRHRFTNICVNGAGTLTLVSRKDHELSIEYCEQLAKIIMRYKTRVNTSRRLGFSHLKTQSEFGFGLSQARWEDGSTATLDSRGLLHLKSSDPAIPECTVVLTDDNLSGWCSDGRVWGERYFIGKDSAPMKQVFDTAIQPFVERLR